MGLLCNTNISAQLAGGEERLDVGAKTHNVELGARREALQCNHHGILLKRGQINDMARLMSRKCASFSPLHCGSWCHSCYRCDPPETAALWWLYEALKVRTPSWGRSSASARGCSECPCGVASSQTPAAGGRQEHKCIRPAWLFEIPGKGNTREHQPFFRARNLFEHSG